jgi:carbamate kinase
MRAATMTDRVAVVAIGGNSLIPDARHQTVPDQYRAAHFGSGSMAPKIHAVISCLERGGPEAIITSPAASKKPSQAGPGPDNPWLAAWA